MSKYIDIHTHITSINTSNNQFTRVKNIYLPEQGIDFLEYFTAGIHPLFVDEENKEIRKKWLKPI